MLEDDLNRAIALNKSGWKMDARQILERIVKDDPKNDKAWMWLADTYPENTNRIIVLEEWLRNNPDNSTAQKGLAALRVKEVKNKETKFNNMTEVDASALEVAIPDHPVTQDAIKKNGEAFIKSNIESSSIVQYEDRSSFWLIFKFLLIIGLGGLILGGVAYLVSKLIWIVLLFPLILAKIASVLMIMNMRKSKIHSAFVGFFFGIVLGLLIYGSFFYFSYLEFRSELRNELVTQLGQDGYNADKQQIEEFIDQGTIELTGQPGFIGYIILLDQEGVSVGLVRTGRTDANLGSALTWVYWIIELVIIIGGGVFGGIKGANRFNTTTGRSYYSR
jgi:hypothetical protein